MRAVLTPRSNRKPKSPEPAWGNALVLRDISGLRMEGFHGRAGSRMTGEPAIRKERVQDAPPKKVHPDTDGVNGFPAVR
jgi:hypothetical protein